MVSGPLANPGPEFWREFAATYYTREPFETDEQSASFTVSSTDLFRLLLTATARHRAGRDAPLMRFHVGQRQVIADLADYLPVAADGSVDGYLRRLERDLGGEPYLLVVEHAQAASRKLWKQAAAFLAGLYDATGSLPRRVDAEVFVGRYPYTIPGIHRERSGVFVTMAQGEKDILVWPPTATGLPLGSARYADAVATSRRLRCAPGRLVYWPAMHWHVGESATMGTAGLHVAVLEEPLTVRELLTDPRSLDGEFTQRMLTGGVSGPHDLTVPPDLELAVESVVTAYADRDAVRDRLVASWLRRRTALGFAVVPPSRKVELRRDMVLCRDSVHPIVVARKDAACSWVAADGRVGYARSAPGLVPLIDRLNCRQPIMVSQALDLATEPSDRAVLLKVLALLVSWRALATGATVQPAAAPSGSALLAPLHSHLSSPTSPPSPLG